MEKLQRERETYQKEITKTKIMSNMTKAIEQGRFTDTHQGQTLMGLLYTPLKEKIEEYFEADLTSHRLKIRQYIQLICDDPKELAYVLVKVLVDIIILKGNNVTITKLSIDLMRALKKLYYFDQLEKTNPKLHSFLGNEYIRASKRRKEELIKTRIKHLIDPTRIENKQLEVRAGAVLLDLVFLAGTDDIIYKRAVKNKDGSQTYIASFRYEILQTLFNEIKVNKQIVDSPMVCPPRDWTSPNSGGYLTRQIPLVKVYNRKDKEIINKADFSKILPVINKLQQIKWRVNKRVYEVISTIFYQNMIDPKSPPTLPRCYGDIPSPNFIDVYDIIPKREYVQNPTEEEKKEWYSWNRQREQIKISLDSEAGRRLEFLSTLTMAEDMIKYEQFYYVYQLDYRGRVYIHSQFLHPQSGGYTKALLEFGEGRILNEEGERWLGVHLANCWGLDKASFDIRKEWVEENKTLILQVAEEPFSTLSIWTEADSPYEFLAACFAYKDFKEGLPVHLPIQLDAVNSGIQFYSGLLLDAEGAESCCVIGNKRSDLYGIIANKVNEKLNNGEYPKFISFTTREKEHITLSTKVEAESLKGKITRNMTKRNVMTVPYSVTIQGMREQNWDVMDEAKLKQKQFWEGDSWVVNYLLTYLIHEAIFETVKGARIGQQYLRDLASLLDEVAIWYTPIYGFPVIQQAYRNIEVRIKTVLGTLMIYTNDNKLHKRKQLSGIAPNFIHSLDGTLLMYCVEHMQGQIGTIHDCFLVHPNDGEQIRTHYKEGYIKIMKMRPLELLSKTLDKEQLIEVPCIGTLNLEEVRDAEYIIN